MTIIANIIGIFAVAAFLLSYQFKKRKSIIVCNATAKVLYIIQYILLHAYDGALLDLLGVISSYAAHRKDKGFIKKHLVFSIVIINLIITAAGIWIYEDVFSIFAIIAVILHTGAFWLNNEKTIRIVSFLGSPFWLVYNFSSAAYGSAIGDILTMVSIGLAIYRYDIIKKNNHKFIKEK